MILEPARPIRTLCEVRDIMAERGYDVSHQMIYELEQKALRKLRMELADWYADWEGIELT